MTSVTSFTLRHSILLTSLFASLGFIQIAQAKCYIASVTNGDVMLTINDQPAKTYKNGETYHIDNMNKVCFETSKNEGEVNITGENYQKRLSEKGDCKNKSKAKKDASSSTALKKILIAFNSGEKKDPAVGGRGTGEKKGENQSIEKQSSATKTMLKEKDGVKHFILLNDSWHANDITLPATLEVFTEKPSDKDNISLRKYKSETLNATCFEIPWTEIEDPNKLGQTYYLKITSKVNSVWMEPTQFRFLSDVK